MNLFKRGPEFVLVLIQFLALYVVATFIGERKKVLLILQNSFIGGTKKFSADLIGYFDSKNYEISVAVAKTEQNHFKENSLGSIPILWFNYTHIDFWFSPKHPAFKYFFLDILKQAVTFLKIKIKTRSSIVVVSSANPPELMPVFMLPGNVFQVVHTIPAINLDPGTNWFLQKFLGVRKQFITVSEFAKNYVQERFGIDSTKCKVLYNFTEDLEQQKTNEADTITIVSVGRVHSSKNPKLFIEVAKELISKYETRRNLSFIWVGDGDLMEYCKSEIKNTPAIQFVGEQEDVRKYLNQADIYFHPSFSESHGISVIEAMSCKLPCVVGNFGGTVESVLDKVNGFTIDPESSTAALEALSVLIEDPELRNDFAEQSKLRFTNLFTKAKWEKSLDNILA